MKPASTPRRVLILLLVAARAWGAETPAARDGTPPGLDAYRQFAMVHDGDAVRGRLLFSDEKKLACTRCHSTDAKGGKVGPDLFAVGDQFSRRDVIEAVLQPSAVIAVGYGTTVVVTQAGEEFSGVLKQSTAEWIELGGADGQLKRLPRNIIQEQRGSTVSLMPEGLQTGLSMSEFTDLVEFLMTLKEPGHARASHQGMPESIPELRSPVPLRPLLREPLRVVPAIATPRTQMQTGLVWVAQMPGHLGVFLAADQSGIVWRVAPDANGDERTVFADFTSEVFSARGPNGLLGLAFHPQFQQNRRYYLKHQTLTDAKIVTVLEERSASPDGRHDSGAPPRRVLAIPAVAEHHNGGCIEFGPDGMLYLGMGDSAPNHDPQGHGQDRQRLLGKMLRIDVDHRDPGLAYAIPADNPFRGQVDVRGEIWASGLREPWRFGFDALTGDLWVADLGQERGDEVGIVRRGENHGWNVYEGFERFSDHYRKPDVVYVPPIFSTRRNQGTTIVGGRVYRADPKSSFYGVYIFGDYGSKRLWGMRQEGRSLKMIRQLATAPQAITAFCTDEQGQVYVCGYAGMIYRLDLGAAVYE